MDSTTHTTTTVEFVDWRAKAKEKLEAEDKLFKGGRAAASVQSYVLRALLNFADQEPRFAEVVCNTERTFSECCAAVVHNAGEVLSDLEAYRKAVQFYFPNPPLCRTVPCGSNEAEDGAGNGAFPASWPADVGGCAVQV